ncbi:MAG: hypothetical protein U9R17_04795 [Thermodesulfobacteriota bacterium]|nr:hypothetical protein [Thermodesulfobacteriota bacterium]
MEFSYNQKREFHSYTQRSVAMGPRGMVASSQQLATLSGYKILLKGGNALDAVVAMASTLNVVVIKGIRPTHFTCLNIYANFDTNRNLA